jgi:hypothetical protein
MLIRTDLKDLKEKYGDERRTRIIEPTNTEFSEEDLIPDLQVLVTITDRGYVKRLPHDTYKRQNRGGRGIIGMTTRDMDAVQHMITCNTLDNLLFLTNRGKVYQLKAHEVPDAGRQAKGLPLVNLVSLEPGELVTGLIAVRDFKNDGKYLILATRQGKIKKTPLPEYSLVRSVGKIALNLEPGDELAAARLSHGESDIIVATRKGQGIRFSENQVRPMGRDTTGVGAIRLVGKGDEVVGMDVIRPDTKASLLIVTTKGMGKRTPIAAFPRQGRAGQGVRAITIIPKGGLVKIARVVSPDDDLLVISNNGQVIRMFADGIPHKGRPAQGVAVMNMRDNDEVASIARVPRTDKSGKMLSDDELEVISEEGEGETREKGNGNGHRRSESIAKMAKVATPSTNGKTTMKTRPTTTAKLAGGTTPRTEPKAKTPAKPSAQVKPAASPKNAPAAKANGVRNAKTPTSPAAASKTVPTARAATAQGKAPAKATARVATPKPKTHAAPATQAKPQGKMPAKAAATPTAKAPAKPTATTKPASAPKAATKPTSKAASKPTPKAAGKATPANKPTPAAKGPAKIAPKK